MWDIEDAQVGYLESQGVDIKKAPREPLNDDFLQMMKKRHPDGNS